MLLSVCTILFYNAYYVFYRFLDKGVIELVGPFGIVYTAQNVMYMQKKMQTGLVYHYSGYMLLFFFISVHVTYEFLI